MRFCIQYVYILRLMEYWSVYRLVSFLCVCHVMNVKCVVKVSVEKVLCETKAVNVIRYKSDRYCLFLFRCTPLYAGQRCDELNHDLLLMAALMSSYTG